MEQCRKMAAAVTLLMAAVALWLTTAGVAAAGATATSPGLRQAHLVSARISAGGTAAQANALTLGGTGIMAVFVAGLAVFALAFLIVIFVRRRMVVV